MTDTDARTAALAEVGRLTLEAAADPAVSLYLVYEMPQPSMRYVQAVVAPPGHHPGNLLHVDVAPDVSDVPEAFRAKAQEVADRFDDMVCEDCGTAPIGYRLVEDHLSGGETDTWYTPMLVRGPAGGVGAVCEDCAPYDAPAPKEES